MSQRRAGILEWFAQRINVTELFSFLTAFGLFYTEVDTRKPLREALAEALRKPIPSYGRWPRVLGLFTLVLLVIEIFTGGLLAFYYLPTPQSAYGSLLTLLQDVPFGWFIHQIHFWGAQLLLIVLVVRLFRFFFQGVYRTPRELVWVFTALLLFVCLHADFTGRFLKWTSVSYWSGVRVLETLSSVPIYSWLWSVAVGGFDISELTLIRYYFLHIAIFPLLMLVLIFLHFSTVRRVGLSDVAHDGSTAGAIFYRNHMANLTIVLALTFGVLSTLAVLFPLPFHGKADPFFTVPGVRPPWYLLAPFGLRELVSVLLSPWAGGFTLLLICLGILGTPFLENAFPRGTRRPLVWVLGIVALAAWVFFTVYGARVA